MEYLDRIQCLIKNYDAHDTAAWISHWKCVVGLALSKGWLMRSFYSLAGSTRPENKKAQQTFRDFHRFLVENSSSIVDSLVAIKWSPDWQSEMKREAALKWVEYDDDLTWPGVEILVDGGERMFQADPEMEDTILEWRQWYGWESVADAQAYLDSVYQVVHDEEFEYSVVIDPLILVIEDVLNKLTTCIGEYGPSLGLMDFRPFAEPLCNIVNANSVFDNYLTKEELLGIMNLDGGYRGFHVKDRKVTSLCELIYAISGYYVLYPESDRIAWREDALVYFEISKDVYKKAISNRKDAKSGSVAQSVKDMFQLIFRDDL